MGSRGQGETLWVDSAAQTKFFLVFGCGWWYDGEIVLLPPLVKIEGDNGDDERDYQAALPSRPQSKRRVLALSRPRR